MLRRCARRTGGERLQWLATDVGDDTGAWFVERRTHGARWQLAQHWIANTAHVAD